MSEKFPSNYDSSSPSEYPTDFSQGTNVYIDAASDRKADEALLNHNQRNYTDDTIDQMDSGLRQLSGRKRLNKIIEDAITDSYNLPNVADQLDEIGNKADIIDKLEGFDEYTDEIEGNGRLIYQTRERRGSRERLPSTNKVLRALFVVENNFGVDTSDNSRVQIERGFHHTKNMATDRLMTIKNQYYRVTIPELNAVLFVSNHRQRETFVFNRQELDQFYASSSGLRATDNLQFGQNNLRKLMQVSHNSGGSLKSYGESYWSDVKQELEKN